MHKRRFLLAVAVVLLVTPVQAQVPVPAASTLDVSVDIGSATIALGSTATTNVTISFSSMGFVCSAEGSASINLRIEDSGLAGVTGSIEPGTVRLVVPAGAYLNNVFRSEGEAILTVKVAKNSLPSHDHKFAVIASYDGGAPQGCAAVQDTQSAEGSAEYNIKTGEADATGTASGSRAGSGAASGSATSSKGSPNLALGVVAVALLGTVLLTRRLKGQAP